MEIGEMNTIHVPETIPEEDEGGQFHEKVVEVVREKMDDVGSSVRGSTGSAYQLSPRDRAGSTGSNCSRKSKFRLSVEMNIKPRTLSESSGVESEECFKEEPISVVVDYPEDMVVTVNARIRKSDVDANMNKVWTDVDPGVGNDLKVEDADADFDGVELENQSQMMNSTFVKVPYTSTFIYPIMEEKEEGDEVPERNTDKDLNRSRLLQASFRKSNDSSIYKTGIDGNDAMFGDLSAILNAGNREDVVDALNTANADFKGHPSLSLNSRARLYPSDKLTPAEKLIKAFHVIARYRGAWGVFEDEQRIVSHLINLNGLLTMTDASVIEAICTDEEYHELNGLISYFLLEKRFIIRSELLQTFKLLCNKSSDIASVILSSEVPAVVARAIVENDYTSKEIYDYAAFFLQMINAVQLSDEQCGDIGHGFYSKLVELIHAAEKNHYESIAEILFAVYLKYHYQLNDAKDLKWDCLSLSVTENPRSLKKLKDKLISLIVKNGTSLSMTYQGHDRDSNEKIQEVLKVLTDLMICTCSREMFLDAELDILLVTLIHFVENDSLLFQTDTLKAIYQILKIIQTEPSGLDRLRRVMKKGIRDWEAAGDNFNRHLLKKICKILNNI
ncbi:NCK-interacting protein with SH3 domain [Orchesella cincta]|uniref:NCK-interacting protein with SH3 domain n=1 Tax=Orchesella cincta TaxID=48709 RepID=A0A1D2NLU8_ORCCI|nr:NCK-interacting protein with SH3 domain [Orchesella cincta]